MAVFRTEKNTIEIEKDSGETIVRIKEAVMGKHTMIVTLEGELSSEAVEILEDEMVSLSICFNQIILELDEVSYISNSVILSFLQLQQIMEEKEGVLVIKGVNDRIKSSFDSMGLFDMFDIR